MSTKSQTNAKFFAVRDFNDAGVEKSFKLGDDITAEPGLGNYQAAGLVTDTDPAASTNAPADAPSA